MTTERTTSVDDADPFAAIDEASWQSVEDLNRALRIDAAGLQATLDEILATAARTIDGVDLAGLNLLRGGAFEPRAFLGEPVSKLDALQKSVSSGPCIDSSRTQNVIRVEEMRDETRWPAYVELAQELGVRSVLCVPLWVDDLRLGAMSLYSRAVDAFGIVQERTAALLAVHAAVALANAQRTENLANALLNRDVIGQAKGILMERHRLTSDAAFTRLSEASQRTNRKLSAVAEYLTSTGVLPD